MKLKLFSFFMFSAISILAQDKLVNNTYDSLVEDFTLALEKKDYNDVIKLIDRVSPNDSIYNDLLITKSYALLELEKYTESNAVIDEALKLKDWNSRYSLLLNKAVNLERLDKLEESIKNYNSILKEYPKSSNLYFNRGLVYLKKKERLLAYKDLERSIKYNPFKKKAHYKIGEFYYLEKKLSQSLMALTTYLLMDPDGENSLEFLKSINLSFSRKSKREPFNLTYTKDDDSFSQIDLILSNGIALNSKYKIKNKIKLPLVKQLHVFFDQLDSYKGQGDFWDSKYVPFFKWIKASGNFDNFVYTICYATTNPSYKKVIEKNTSNIVSFLAEAKEKWSHIIAKDNIELFQEKEQAVQYVFNGSKLIGLGKAKGENKIGVWDIYDEEGKIKGQGEFSDKGERNGFWKWYNKEGKLTQTVNYHEGKYNGEIIEYGKNDKVAYKYNYVEGKINGEYFEYNKNGKLIIFKNFKNDKLDGEYSTYYDLGKTMPKIKGFYVEGKLEGSYKTFYNSGETFSEIIYKNGIFNGEEITYYRNKQIKSKSNYLDNKLNGKYIGYYKNGNIENEGQYINDVSVGDWKTYYEDGNLKEETSYNNKGKLSNEYKEYDIDGKLSSIFEYKNGLIVSTSFLNKKTEIIEFTKRKGGNLNYKGYSPLGQLEAKGIYDVKGGKVGLWKFYEYGALKNETSYKKGKLDGDNNGYFIDNKTEFKDSYKEDLLEGYSVGYYGNGQIEYQGYNKDGEKVGEWRSYYVNGTISNINFYHKGKKHGVQKYFGVKGQLYNENYYKNGLAIKEVYYKPDGSVLEEIILEDYLENKIQEYKHYNGKTHSIIEYVGGKKHGPYKKFHFNGKVSATGNYFMNKKHGLWQKFDYKGNLTLNATYNYGQLEGKSEEFTNGKLEEIEQYVNGNLEGLNTIYYPDGKTIDKEFMFKSGANHGFSKFYAPNGKLQFVRFYHNNNLIGYSYNNSKGKLIPMITLPEGSGKLEAYFDNGKKSAEIEMKHGEFVGVYKKYFYNGNIQESNKYSSNGDRNGKSIDYYFNGKAKEEIPYVSNEISGKRKFYNEDGSMYKEYNYLNGNLDGKMFEYNKQGQKIKERLYFNGVIYTEN